MTYRSRSPHAGLQRHRECSGQPSCPTRRMSTHLCCQNQFLSCCHRPLIRRLTSLQLSCCPPHPLSGPHSPPRRICEIPRHPQADTLTRRSSCGPPGSSPQAPHCPAPRVTGRGPHPSKHPGAPQAPSFVRTAWRGHCGPGSLLLRLVTPTQLRPWPRAPAAPEHRRTQTERTRSESSPCHSKL